MVPTCTHGPSTLEAQLLMTEILRDLGGVLGAGGEVLALLRVLILHLTPSYKCSSLKFHFVAFRLWGAPPPLLGLLLHVLSALHKSLEEYPRQVII